LRRTCLQHGFAWQRRDRLNPMTKRHLMVRLAHFAILVLRAWKWRLKNSRVVELTPQDVTQELATFEWVGRTAERLVGRSPRLRDWLAGHLA
jgi:hypothetical protein